MKPQQDPSNVVTEVEELKEEVKRLNGWVTAGKVAVPALLAFLGYTNIFAVPREVAAGLKGSVLDEYKLRAESAAISAENAMKETQGLASQAAALLADLEKRTPIQDGDQISLTRSELLLVVDNKDQGPDIRTGWREEHDRDGRTKFRIEKQ